MPSSRSAGVKPTNIIDTPLGMMGVEVRQAVLRYAVEHSGQLVMFLTGSEVMGVEELLDEYAGKSYTFSNAAHYPTKLLNDPSARRRRRPVPRIRDSFQTPIDGQRSARV